MVPAPVITAPSPTDSPWTLDVLGAPAVAFTVIGSPAPQGSKTAGVRSDGSRYMRESSKKVRPWRENVTGAALRAVATKPRGWVPLGDKRHGVVCDVVFTLARPVSLPKYGRFRPATRPDIDKYLRATLDALVHGSVLCDDGVVVAFRRLETIYAGDPDPDTLPDGATGAVIRVWSLTPEGPRP